MTAEEYATPDPILGFFDEYRFLSNFSEDGFDFMGHWYRTNEHFYQAAKAMYDGDARRIIAAETPGKAKRLGRQIDCRPDWEDIKDSVMRLGISLKFRPGTVMALKLADTRFRYLEETNTWGDKYWGVCGGVGQNRLGYILMQQRIQIEWAMTNRG